MRLVVALVMLVPALARADMRDVERTEPCGDAVIDPIVTPVREAALDAQRGACLRDQLSAGILGHALIDTPGFHGVLGGGLVLGGRMVVAKAHELSAELNVVDYTFVQNAVNKVTHAGLGPVVLGAAAGASIGAGGRAAIALRVELPYTRDNMDTLHASSQLVGVVTGALAPRWVLHARLGTIGMVASSAGGTTTELAFTTGADLAWHLRQRLALQLGADVMAGWQASFDHLLVRAGVTWRIRGDAWRLRIGLGAPVAGAERTNAVLDVGVVVDR